MAPMAYHKRCQFKILVFTYKSLKNEAPSYISDLLQWYQPNRPLRSANTTSIIPKRYKSVRYGKRLMDTGAAMRRNSLPNELNPIRSGLFQTVNDPGGGGFKSPPPPYDLKSYRVNLHHIIHVNFTRCFWHDLIGIIQKFAILTILQRFQNKK